MVENERTDPASEDAVKRVSVENVPEAAVASASGHFEHLVPGDLQDVTLLTG